MTPEPLPTVSSELVGALLQAAGQGTPGTTADWLTNILQIVLVGAIPVLARFAQRYVNASTSEKNVETIARLASAAIDYVEHVGLRQRLDPALEAGVGGQLDKLETATVWLERELKRMGINMPATEAQEWVKSELQRRVDELPPTHLIQKIAAAAIADVVLLAESGQLTPPAGETPLDYWSRLAADRLRTHLAQTGSKLTVEDAVMWVRTAWMDSQLGNAPSTDLWRPPVSGATSEERLAQLAADAKQFVQRLEARGLSIHGDDVTWYLLVSRMVTEAARQGFDLSVEQIFATAAGDRPTSPTEDPPTS